MSHEFDELLAEAGLSDDLVLRSALAEMHDSATAIRPMPTAELRAVMIRPRRRTVGRTALVTSMFVIGGLGAGFSAAAVTPEGRGIIASVVAAVFNTGPANPELPGQSTGTKRNGVGPASATNPPDGGAADVNPESGPVRDAAETTAPGATAAPGAGKPGAGTPGAGTPGVALPPTKAPEVPKGTPAAPNTGAGNAEQSQGSQTEQSQGSPAGQDQTREAPESRPAQDAQAADGKRNDNGAAKNDIAPSDFVRAPAPGSVAEDRLVQANPQVPSKPTPDLKQYLEGQPNTPGGRPSKPPK